jgi:hypothetical protein
MGVSAFGPHINVDEFARRLRPASRLPRISESSSRLCQYAPNALELAGTGKESIDQRSSLDAALDYAVLHFDARIDHAAELDDASVTPALDDAAVMRGDRGVDQVTARRPRSSDCTRRARRSSALDGATQTVARPSNTRPVQSVRTRTKFLATTSRRISFGERPPSGLVGH